MYKAGSPSARPAQKSQKNLKGQGASSTRNGLNNSKDVCPPELARLLDPDLARACPAACKERAQPAPEQSQSSTIIRQFYLDNCRTQIEVAASDIILGLDRYAHFVDATVLHLIRNEDSLLDQEAPPQDAMTPMYEAVVEAFNKTYPNVDAVNAGGLIGHAATAVFIDTLRTVAVRWDLGTQNRPVCLHSLDAIRQISARDAGHRRDVIKAKRESVDASLSPIEHLVEQMQNLVATRQVRGNPWNQPRRCRSALNSYRDLVNGSTLKLLIGRIRDCVFPLNPFFALFMDPSTFFVNVHRLGYHTNLIPAPLRSPAQASGVSPESKADVRTSLERVAWYLFEDPGWAKFVAREGPRPRLPSSSASPSPTPTPTNSNAPTSKSTADAGNSRNKPEKKSPSPTASTSGTNAPPTVPRAPGSSKKKKRSKASGMSGANSPSTQSASIPSASTSSKTSQSRPTGPADKRFEQLEKERIRIEGELDLVEAELARSWYSRRSTDKDLWAGEWTDTLVGLPRAPPLPFGQPADPTGVLVHDSSLFIDLPYLNPVKICPPHLHRVGTEFNHAAVDTLDYALTDIFHATFVLEVSQVNGPILLESIRDATLSYLFEKKLDARWGSETETARMISEVVDQVIREETFEREEADQLIGNGAVLEALREARLQIQQAVNADEPRLGPYSDRGSPCICELTMHVPAIERLCERLRSAALAYGPAVIFPGSGIDRARVVEMVQRRGKTLVGDRDPDSLNSLIDKTISDFETAFNQTCSRRDYLIKALWQTTESLIKWIGGVRLWEESKRMAIPVEATREAHIRKMPYGGITSMAGTCSSRPGKPPLRPVDFGLFKASGDVALKGGSFDEAACSYDVAALACPDNVAARTNAALARIKRGRVVDAHVAISDCTAALAYAPRSIKALYRRSIALQRIGRSDLAIDDLELALEFEPNHVEVKAELARLNPLNL